MSNFLKETIDNLQLGICSLNKEKKIIYWNKGAENIVGFADSEVNGRKFGLAKEGCPIALTLDDGEIREANAYIHNKNGKKVHVSYKVVPNRNEEGKIIGASVMFHDVSAHVEMIRRVKELQEIASVDFMTGLPNRRMFEKNLNAALEEMHRHGKKFGVIFMDIDNFKIINDKYGHDMGDLVLKMVAAKLASTVRPYDVVGRWGGEEFVALIPYVDRERLHTIASRLRSMVERMSVFTGESVIKVTMSIGAAIAKEDDNIQGVIKRADKLMYMSKNTGKNKVTIEVKS